MTPLPKKKVSKARRGRRQAATSYQQPKLAACPRCGKLRLPHILCPSCGYYNNRMVFEPKEKTKVTKVKEA